MQNGLCITPLWKSQTVQNRIWLVEYAQDIWRRDHNEM